MDGDAASRTNRRVEEKVEAHNRSQQLYFKGPINRTIVPRNSPQLQRFLDKTLRFGSVSPTDRVLEVGCGMGRFTLMLAQLGVRIEGLDLSRTLLDRLQTFNADRFDIPLHCADARNPPRGLEG